MPPILQTQRLSLRHLKLSDARFIMKLVNSPGWLKYIGDRRVHSLDDAEAYLRNGPLHSYEVNGFGLWCVVSKESFEPIGMCGFLKRPVLESVDIGFALLPGFEGRGYGSEIAAACLQYGHEKYRLNRVLGITMPDNRRSIAVLERLGMRYVRPFKIETESEPLMLYERLFDDDPSTVT